MNKNNIVFLRHFHVIDEFLSEFGVEQAKIASKPFQGRVLKTLCVDTTRPKVTAEELAKHSELDIYYISEDEAMKEDAGLFSGYELIIGSQPTLKNIASVLLNKDVPMNLFLMGRPVSSHFIQDKYL